VSVDDFGTGYSSLAYLRRFPLDAVKIDGSFIRDVTTNAEDASITLTIIDLAHRLNLQVIAECVETAEQLEFLRAHGCDQIQGYHLARPMPADELERLWRATFGSVPGSAA
jgi:EAL domain-containing protein (putative c-di-GMP-specific phosphodiesterase class I)